MRSDLESLLQKDIGVEVFAPNENPTKLRAELGKALGLVLVKDVTIQQLP